MTVDEKHPDRGYLYERTVRDRVEMEFATTWETRQLSNATGAYLDMIIGEAATLRDRFVAASVIQWLGTNVGFAFLTHVLHHCGYAVIGSEAREHRLSEPLLVEIKQQHYNATAAQITFDMSEPS